MGERFGGLRLCQAVIQRSAQAIGNLGNLTCSNESTDGDKTTIPRRQVGASSESAITVAAAMDWPEVAFMMDPS